MTTLLFVLQVALPLALLVWHVRARVRTLTAWGLMTIGIGSYVVAIAVIGNWEALPEYTPFLFLLGLGASIWHRDAWIRSLPARPHSNDEWREAANCGNVALAGMAVALVAIATRPIAGETGWVDAPTVNLYRQLGSTIVGFIMFVAALRSPSAGRVLLSALFVWAAGTNLRIAVTSPGDYVNFAQFAVLDVYRGFITGFFARHAGGLIAAIALGQAIVAFLMATKGRPRRVGFVGAIVFLLAIVPLGVGSGFPATILIALAAAEVLHTDRYAVFGRNITATDAEAASERPGDDLIGRPLGVMTHAVTIFKPARDVWPWLVQMGAGRGGWYSYDRLDNGGEASATCIVPELQAIHVGMVFPALPALTETFEIERLDPGRSLVLATPGPHGPVTTWAFVLEEPAADITRLIVRVRVAWPPRPIRTAVMLPFLRAVHFIMERKQLNTLALRAEKG